MITFPFNYCGTIVKNQLAINVRVYFWNLNSIPLISMSVYIYIYMASQVALLVKNSPANARDIRVEGSIPGLGRFKDPLVEGMATTPVVLPGESHGQRSLLGYSP